MNIYSYIPSTDIATYCEKICHKFNPLEMAVIVAMSGKTIIEKHTAWKQIITEHPDMPIHQCINFDARDSLHEYLHELINYEENLIRAFYSTKAGEVCRFSLMWLGDNGLWSDGYPGAYSTVDKAWSAYREQYGDYERDLVQVKIEKVLLDSEDCVYSACMTPNGELLCLDRSMDSDKPDSLDMIFIDVPLPFKKGDLVAIDGAPHVLEWIPHWWGRYGDLVSGEIGDGSDMIFYTYSISENGNLVRDHHHALLQLEYYKVDLMGSDCFLKCISQFIKTDDKNMYIDWLINTYLMYRAEAESERLSSRYGGDGLIIC